MTSLRFLSFFKEDFVAHSLEAAFATRIDAATLGVRTFTIESVTGRSSMEFVDNLQRTFARSNCPFVSSRSIG